MGVTYDLVFYGRGVIIVCGPAERDALLNLVRTAATAQDATRLGRRGQL